MAGIFSRIIAGEIPSFKVYEDERVYAFLDIRPLKPGHTLLIPKQEIDYLFDIEGDLYDHLFRTARTIATAIKKVIPCTKVGMSVIGLEVPHAHIHLVPIDEIADMTFGGSSAHLSNDEQEAIASRIRAELAQD